MNELTVLVVDRGKASFRLCSITNRTCNNNVIAYYLLLTNYKVRNHINFILKISIILIY